MRSSIPVASENKHSADKCGYAERMEHQSLDVVGAVVVGLDRQQPSVLAFRRRAEKAAGGRWEFPGGKVERGESHASALARELEEELSVRAHVGELVGRTETNVEDAQILLSCYFVKLSSIPNSSSDHDQIQWVSKDSARALEWADPDVPIVEAVFAEGSPLWGLARDRERRSNE